MFTLTFFALALADAPLGKLSEKYESGGRGPGTVSSGKGDPGGVSYGSYQLASKIGRADAFVKKYFPEEFKGLKGGTPEFTAKWKELAKDHTEKLKAAEHEYIKDTHYDPQVKKLQEALELDVKKRSAAFRDVVWSVAVHHGPNTTIIITAAKTLTTDGKKLADITDEALMKAIYAERGRKDKDGKLVHFKGVSDDWIPALSKRFENELKDALQMLHEKK